MTSRANRWKRLRYSLYAPFYDFGLSFDRERRAAIGALRPAAGEHVLIVGVGTGADLPHLPAGVRILATDYSPAMLARATARAGDNVELRVMNGEALELADGCFDAALLHQILAVIPDPVRCLRETARVLRPGGRISVFDKFLPDGTRLSAVRGWGLRSLDTVFTSATWTLPDLLAAARVPLAIEAELPNRRPFRTVILRKHD